MIELTLAGFSYAFARVVVRVLRAWYLVAADNAWIEPTLDRLALLGVAWCALRQFGPVMECVCR
jgi:hypothetical protein